MVKACFALFDEAAKFFCSDEALPQIQVLSLAESTYNPGHCTPKNCVHFVVHPLSPTYPKADKVVAGQDCPFFRILCWLFASSSVLLHEQECVFIS